MERSAYIYSNGRFNRRSGCLWPARFLPFPFRTESKSITIVVSPLAALMKGMKEKFVPRGANAEFQSLFGVGNATRTSSPFIKAPRIRVAASSEDGHLAKQPLRRLNRPLLYMYAERFTQTSLSGY